MKTYNQLISEFERLKKDIDSVRDYEAQLIAEKVITLLYESGIDVRKIFGVATSNLQDRRRAKVKPIYWNRETGATWSGRGKTPRWLVGQDLEKFRIPDSMPDDDDLSTDETRNKSDLSGS
ncbi:H-NS histone family protein [Burkholderia seminalis]|uniref:H-NS histone family protein n=1 Tax=Burkholderia seminalis TaxID=488731 RepID=UPI002655FB5B|nr:H-NS histone family protein [Burkholderia seminalis]MDN7592393.1 H-NS histone family protein [Burkholderia seminalis]